VHRPIKDIHLLLLGGHYIAWHLYKLKLSESQYLSAILHKNYSIQAIYCCRCRYFKVGIYYILAITSDGIWDLKAKVYAMCFGTYKGGYLKFSTFKKKNLVMNSKNHPNNCQSSILDFNKSPTLENISVEWLFIFMKNL
jgi:hypothetical protein